MAWPIAPVRTFVERTFGRASPIQLTIDGLDRYSSIFNYHMATSRDAMDDVVDKDDPVGTWNLQLVLGASEEQRSFRNARLVSESHLVATVLTARNFADLFAFLTHDLLMPGRLEERRVNLRSVTDALDPCDLKVAMNRLQSTKQFRYVADLANASKHRFLPQQGFHLDYDEGKCGIRISGFEYGGRSHPGMWDREVLEAAIYVKNGIVDAGSLLNKSLSIE